MTTIVATDLDGTVMFSAPALAAAGVPTAGAFEVDTGPVCAYMTADVSRDWERLVATAALVPVTTRSVPQYLRLRLPGRPPPLAVVCNGGRLLVEGRSDEAWERSVRDALRDRAAPFEEIWNQAVTWQAQRGFKVVRPVEDFFAYLIVERREAWLSVFAAEAAAWATPRGWHVSLQDRKVYLLPQALDKAAAVARVARRMAASRVVAGGDSLLDAGMLASADAAIRPAHGELHEMGFTAPHCRTTSRSGAAAGDEILHWYRRQTGEAVAAQDAPGNDGAGQSSERCAV